jgi:hypothetical protein
MKARALHIPGEPYAAAASRHQAAVDREAAEERHYEAAVLRLRKMTVEQFLDELGPRDRAALEGMIEIHATGWRM